MKSTRKLIPALALLLVSAVIMTTASFAWFTMSREVTANAMNVTVTAPNNLLISDNSSTGFAASAEVEADAGTVIVPASSIKGADSTFYVLTNDVNADGSRHEDSEFKTLGAATSTAEGAYVDFKYYLKTDGADAVSVGVSNVALTQTGASNDGLKAVRFAVVNSKVAVAATGAAGEDVVSSTRQVASRDYIWGDTTGAYGTTVTLTSAKAIESLTGTKVVEVDDIETMTAMKLTNPAKAAANETDTDIFTVKKGEVVEITIRVWLDGEDANCIATTAANMNFDLTVKFADVAKTTAA